MSSSDILDEISDRTSGFAYVARKVDLTAAEKVRKLKIDGIGTLPDSRRVYPEGALASQVLGAVGTDNQGLSGLESMYQDVLGGSDGEAEVTRDALGPDDQARDRQRCDHGRRRQADARRRASEPNRGRAGPDRPDLRPRRRDRDRDQPALLGGSRARQLARGRPQRPRQRLARGPDQHGDGVHLRAGLDVQGVHRRRGARAGARDAGHRLRPAADDQGRRPRDRGVARARPGQPQRRRHPRPVLERRRGQDRPRGRRRGLRPLDPPLRLRRADRRAAPGRGAGNRPGARRLLGLDDGQPADRPGAVGDPDADGGRLRGDRQRRRPASAAARARRRRRAGRRPTTAHGS